MFKKHPKGLLAAALANMGERFGFYTMMAILSLFLMSKFGLSGSKAGLIYSIFYFSIYVLAFVGGLIADKTKNYKGTILVGLILMSVGYFLIAIPTGTPVPADKFVLFLSITCFGLLIIAFGNGLFKGNLQALVGQMYDNEQYKSFRDTGFQWFYMFINVGAMFAPFAAMGIRNWWVTKNGFAYNADLPRLCHAHLDGKITEKGVTELTTLAEGMGHQVSNIDGSMTIFAEKYLNVFATGFHYAFAIAIGAMAISMVIYLVNKKRFPDPAAKKMEEKATGVKTVEMGVAEIRQRMFALFAVFAVVIFFWFCFHQNGLTLTYFARDYTLLKIGSWSFGVEAFQSVNPFLVVFLTPIIIAFFGWLRAKGKEPSTPKKIAIGMFIAALGFVVMAIGSYGLPTFNEVEAMGKLPDVMKVTPFLLIGTYLILTVAELFISPLGISFVSKVAPPKYQGMMQGLWLCATAVGNQLLFIVAILYENIPIWVTWTVLVGACLLSMCMMLAMLKWLEKVAK